MKLTLPVECEECGHTWELPLEEAYPGQVVACPFCRVRIGIQGDDGRKLQREVDKLDKALAKISLG